MKNAHAVVVLLLVFTAFRLSAQDYKTAIGARLGSPLSLSAKQFIGEKNAIEAFVGFRNYSSYSWVNVGGLFQRHSPISELEGLSWFYGGGAAVYFWKYDFVFLNDNSATNFAVLGCGGLDYKFQKAPVNVSLDWVPAVFINSYYTGLRAGYGAVSVRYVIK